MSETKGALRTGSRNIFFFQPLDERVTFNHYMVVKVTCQPVLPVILKVVADRGESGRS
jgi:hypothetical protein